MVSASATYKPGKTFTCAVAFLCTVCTVRSSVFSLRAVYSSLQLCQIRFWRQRQHARPCRLCTVHYRTILERRSGRDTRQQSQRGVQNEYFATLWTKWNTVPPLRWDHHQQSNPTPATRGRCIREGRIYCRQRTFPVAVKRAFSSNNEWQVNEKQQQPIIREKHGLLYR